MQTIFFVAAILGPLYLLVAALYLAEAYLSARFADNAPSPKYVLTRNGAVICTGRGLPVARSLLSGGRHG